MQGTLDPHSLWFADVDYQRWDEQLEQDIADGKLDALAEGDPI